MKGSIRGYALGGGGGWLTHPIMKILSSSRAEKGTAGQVLAKKMDNLYYDDLAVGDFCKENVPSPSQSGE